MSKREPDTESTEHSSVAETAKTGLSRRGFLKGAGFTAAGTALIDGIQVFNQNAAAATVEHVREQGPGPVPITLNINGRPHTVELEPNTTLADALRDQLGLTGTKVVCDRGACSACTVLLDRTPVNSCMTLAIDVGGRKITTIEGIAQNGALHPLQAAFVKHDAMQCGFCTPGMVMSCAALLERKAHPSLADVRTAVSGNLCRCGTYPKVFEATLEAAGVISDRKPSTHTS